MVDAVLLEWEGVLADTRRARRDALRSALAAEGVSHTLSDDDEQLRGLGVRAAVRVVLRHMGCSDETLADLLEARASRAFAAELGRGLVLAPGAAGFVERMRSRARIAIVTRASRVDTETILHLSGFEDAVTTMVCADDLAADAAPSAAFTQAIAQLGRVRVVEQAQAVAIVDALPGIRAARSAGLRVLAVGAPAHEALEADVAFDSLDNLTFDDLAARGSSSAEGGLR